MNPEESGAPSAAPESAASDDDEPYQQMPQKDLGRVAVYVDWPNISRLMPKVDVNNLTEALHERYHPKRLNVYVQGRDLRSVAHGSVISRARMSHREHGPYKDVDPLIICDMAFSVNDFDSTVLVSGDSDFWYALQRLRHREKRIVVHWPEPGAAQIYTRDYSPVIDYSSPLAALLIDSHAA